MTTKRGLVNQPAGIISRQTKRLLLGIITVGMLASAGWMFAKKATPEAAAVRGETVRLFEPLLDTVKFTDVERYSLYAILGVAVAGLLYAAMLAKQVLAADKGTPRMQEIAARRARRGQRLSGRPVPQDRAADHRHHRRCCTSPSTSEPGVCLRPRRRLPRRLDVQLAGRLRAA